MANINLSTLTIATAKEAIKNQEYTAEALTTAYLSGIKKRNTSLNAYLEVFTDALDQARVVDKKIKQREAIGALAGIPLAIKDNILIAGKISSSASKMLANYRAAYDATVITKLKQADAIFLGRTNMDEFAMGSSTENSAFGPTKNPYDESRVPGGTSGGSAVAVAADLALGALGSDTGGSVRQPASFCGVVGLKPTYGAVSRSGLTADTSSFDQIGPIAKNIADAELIFKVITGRDPADSTSVSAPKRTKRKPKRLGVPIDFLTAGVSKSVLESFNATVEKLRIKGSLIENISLPSLHYSLACYYIIQPAEVSTNLARFDGMRYGFHNEGVNLLEEYLASRGAGFGPEVKRRILLGTYVLSAGYYDAYYARATAVRLQIKADFAKAFKKVDAIVLPTAPSTAWKIGEKTNDPLQMYLEDIFTVPANLAGLPAISVPAGHDEHGLPIGFQIIGPAFNEDRLFELGRQIETL